MWSELFLRKSRPAERQDGSCFGDIVEGSDVLYVFLMQEPDCTALAQYYFKQLVSDAQTNAKVKTSRAYDKIDSASFYTGLQEARSALATSLQGDGANAAG